MTFHFMTPPLRRAVLFIALSSLLSLASCQTLPEDAGSGSWANVTLHVTGIGAINADWTISERIQAIQEAKVDAYKQLESQIMALQTSSGDKISDLSAKDDSMQKKITAFVRGAKIIRTENDPKGVKILAQLFLGDSFKATIGLAKKKQQQLSNPNARDSSSRY